MSLGKLFTSQLKNIVRFKPEQQQEVANPFEDLMKNIEPLHKKEEQAAQKSDTPQDQGWALEDEGVIEGDTPPQSERIPSPKAMPEKQPTSIMVQSPASLDQQSKTVEIKTYNELPSMTLLNNTSQKNSFQQDSKKFLSMLGLKKNDDKQGYLDRVLSVNLQLFQMQELAQLERQSQVYIRRAEQINEIQNMKIKALEEVQAQKDALQKREELLNEKEASLKSQQDNVRIAQNIIEKFQNADQKECFERAVQENLKLNDDIQGLNNLQNQIQQDYEDQLLELTLNMEKQQYQHEVMVESLQAKIQYLNDRTNAYKKKLRLTKQALGTIKNEMADIRSKGMEQFQTALHKTDEIKELVEQTFSKYVNPILKRQNQEFEFYAQENMQKLAFKDDEISQLYEELDKIAAVQLKEKEAYNTDLNSKKQKITILQEEIQELKTIIKENDSHSFKSIDEQKNKIQLLEKQLQDQEKIKSENREYQKRIKALEQQELENLKLKEQVKKLEEDIKNSKKQQDLGSLFSSVSNNQEPANSLWGLATKGRTLASPQKSNDQYEKELKQLKAEIQKLRDQVEQQKKLEPEEDQWGLDIEDKNETQNSTFLLMEKENEINQIREELSTKDKEIKYLLDTIKSQQKTLEENEETQSQQLWVEKQLQERIQSNDKQFQTLKQKISDLEQVRDAAISREQQLKQQITELTQALQEAQLNIQTQETEAYEHKIEEQQKQIRMLTQELERVNSQLTENQTKEMDQEEQMQKLQYFLVDAEYNSNLQKNKMQQEIHDLKLALEFAHQEVRNSSRGISSKRKSTENDDEIEHQLLEEEEKADSDYEYPEEENGWRTEADEPFYQGHQNSDDYYQFGESSRLRQDEPFQQQIDENVEESDNEQKEDQNNDEENKDPSDQLVQEEPKRHEASNPVDIQQAEQAAEPNIQIQDEESQVEEQKEKEQDQEILQNYQPTPEEQQEKQVEIEQTQSDGEEQGWQEELEDIQIQVSDNQNEEQPKGNEIQDDSNQQNTEQQNQIPHQESPQKQNIQDQSSKNVPQDWIQPEIQDGENNEQGNEEEENKGWTIEMDIEEPVREDTQVEEEHKNDLEQVPYIQEDQNQSLSPKKQDEVDTGEQPLEEHKENFQSSVKEDSQENIGMETNADIDVVHEQTEQKNGFSPVEKEAFLQQEDKVSPDSIQKVDEEGEGWDVQDDNPNLLEEEFKNEVEEPKIEKVQSNQEPVLDEEVIEGDQGWGDIECELEQNQGVDEEQQKSAPLQESQNFSQNNLEKLIKQPKSEPLPKASQNDDLGDEDANVECGWGEDIDLVLDEEGEPNGIIKDASTTWQQDQEY